MLLRTVAWCVDFKQSHGSSNQGSQKKLRVSNFLKKLVSNKHCAFPI